ncbi:hypothetical protein LARI1_G006213 [Lachnellula arida]|uniref:EthD domain-containing protein n=1 Tax=Lachnellula arida TaxID=1316785 RepID=A0A8T9B2H9_9HELO|nr:hypothetical protein LARI1_G006213 [Lachnellula arida]
MVVRVTLLIKKLDTLTDEEFHNYWKGPHAQIFLGVPIVKEKILKFSLTRITFFQFRVDKTTSAVLAAQGLPVAEYDEGVNHWAASLDDIMAVGNMYKDPEYQRLVLADAEVFSKTKESKMMIRYDKDFVADGKVL